MSHDQKCTKYPPKIETYRDLSDATNGQFINIYSNDTAEVVRDLCADLDDGASILDVKELVSGNNSIPVLVAKTLKDFKVSVAGESPSIVVMNPNNEVSEKAKEVLDLDTVKTVHVENPEPGEWKVITGAKETHTVKVSGNSNVTFEFGFSLHSPNSLAETQLIPFFNYSNYFYIEPSDPLALVSLDEVLFFTPTFNLSVPLNPVRASSSYVCTFEPPKTIFKIEVFGKDANGNPFKRLLPTAVNCVKVTQPQYLGKAGLEQFIKLPPGNSVNLDCVMAGDPQPKITWFKNDVQLPNTTDTLLLGDSEKADYRCVGTNSAGSLNVTFHVNTENPPEVIEGLLKYKNDSLVKFDKESTNFLNCPVKGEPEPTITWYKDGSPVINSSTVVLSSNSQNIRFHEIGWKVAGRYKCVAENSQGSVSLHYTVQSNGPPMFQDPIVRVAANGSINITFNVELIKETLCPEGMKLGEDMKSCV